VEKLFYLLFRTTDESSIQEGGKVTTTNSSIFSDRMDIFWLSVFVKLFKRKVKFRHNRLHAQPYILLRTSTCAAHTCVDHKIDFSFSIVNNAHGFIISIHSESSSPYSRACNMLYKYVGLILPPPPPWLLRGFASCATPSPATRLYEIVFVNNALAAFSPTKRLLRYFSLFIRSRDDVRRVPTYTYKK